MKGNGKKASKCCICGKPALSNHSRYYRICSRLAFRMKIRRFPPEAVDGVWDYVRANGYRCYYTHMPLEMDDIKSPWFCIFDHLIPLDPMKSDLSEKEFWYYIRQLANYIKEPYKSKKEKAGLLVQADTPRAAF